MFYSDCLAYIDIHANIRLYDDAIFLTISDKNNNSVQLTFNPFQLLTLTKYLYSALDKVTLEQIYNTSIFGNLTVEVEDENFVEPQEIPVGCYDNHFVYAESA